MKGIAWIGVISLVGLGIFAVLSMMQRQATDKMIQEDDTGFFQEKKQEAWVASAEGTEAIPHPHPLVSGPSWLDPLQNAIEDCFLAIKNLPTSLGHLIHRRSRLAPPGVYFTLTYMSVRKPSGIIGVNAGTRVVCVKDEGAELLVKAGDLEFEAKRQYLTNDLDVADRVVRGDAKAQ
jgi:hypothetical protein